MGELNDKKKYNCLENILNKVSTKIIAISEKDCKPNNVVLKHVIDIIITRMKEKNALFKTIFQIIFYGGSYYDGLKTGAPEEYDLDLVFVINKNAKPVLHTLESVPGFVTLEINDLDKIDSEFKNNFMAGSFVVTAKVSQWMESIVTKVMDDLPKNGIHREVIIDGDTYLIKFNKSGPAFTLNLTSTDRPEIKFDVDFVPCFLFTEDMWPSKPFRKNTTKKTTFFIVPKAPSNDDVNAKKCWRLSFQEQERILICDRKTLKPCIKLIKTLRDKLQQKGISSYFIKTIFLWEVLKHDVDYWNSNSLSFIFMRMINIYAEHIGSKTIPYYWNKEFNLLSHKLKDSTLEGYSNRIKNIIGNINKNLVQDPYFVATFYLSTEEVDELKDEVGLSKKSIKALENLNKSSEIPSNSNISVISLTDNCDIKTILKEVLKLQEENEILKSYLKINQDENKTIFALLEKMNSKLDTLCEKKEPVVGQIFPDLLD